MDSKTAVRKQTELCERYGVDFVASPQHLKVGIAHNVREGVAPINGLRHPATEGTTGWYIWAGGEPPDDPHFFVPLHVSHLDEWCPEVLPFLGLPPGWRFLLANDHEDVWEDRALLEG